MSAVRSRQAFDPSEPKKYCTSLPETRGNQPVKVQISLHLLDILDVDQSEHTWTVRSFLYASWRDQRLKYKIKDFDRLSKLVYRGDLASDQMLRMWHPYLTIPNQKNRVKIPQHTYGTLEYIAPELNNGYFYKNSDVWSVGIMIYLLLSDIFIINVGSSIPLFGSINNLEKSVITNGQSKISDNLIATSFEPMS